MYLVLGLVLGLLVATMFASSAVNMNNQRAMRMMGMRVNEPEVSIIETDMGMATSMDEMMGSFQDKVGDARDRAFLEAMVVHHQGAIKMAEFIRDRTERKEIANLAKQIIASQTKEVNTMKSWIASWY